jgi:DNA-directed RNA polymerase II subunit RPB3
MSQLPRIEIGDLDGYKGTFYLYGAGHKIANDLKVVMMDEVPIMAIDVVNVTTNGSLLTDELLVHRLGLIPLMSQTVGDYVFPKECSCNIQCPKCSAVINLKIEPSPEAKFLRQITSLDLIPKEGHQVNPVRYTVLGKEQGIAITPIRNDQSIDLECFAIKGRGSDHTKWSPVCKAVYWPDEMDKSRIIFEVETTGCLTVPELIKSACQIMSLKSLPIKYN